LERLLYSLEQIYREHGKKIFYFLILTTLTLGILYFLAQPSDQYTRDRGAPWGQRFK
jgi:hypothetical protein